MGLQKLGDVLDLSLMALWGIASLFLVLPPWIFYGGAVMQLMVR